MVWYNYPNATDSEGIYEFFRYINVTADGLFFPVILLSIWFITIVSTIATGDKSVSAIARSFTFATFVSSILSIMLSIMGFLAPKFMYLNFIMLAFGILWMKSTTSTID